VRAHTPRVADLLRGAGATIELDPDFQKFLYNLRSYTDKRFAISR
jgi:hypothetical protein